MVILPSLAAPTILFNKLGLEGSLDIGLLLGVYKLDSFVSPTTEEDTSLKPADLHWSCYHGWHHGRWCPRDSLPWSVRSKNYRASYRLDNLCAGYQNHDGNYRESDVYNHVLDQVGSAECFAGTKAGYLQHQAHVVVFPTSAPATSSDPLTPSFVLTTEYWSHFDLCWFGLPVVELLFVFELVCFCSCSTLRISLKSN